MKAVEEKYKQAFLARESNLTVVLEDGEIPELPKVTYRKDSLIIKRL